MAQTRQEENIVILGAGISGLATIATIIKNRLLSKSEFPVQIDVVEKRDFNFDRRQKLIDNPLFRDDLSWVGFAKSFFNPNNKLALDSEGNLVGPGVTKPLNQYHSFLQKMLRQENAISRNQELRLNFSIKELQLALYEYIQEMKSKCKNFTINWHPNSTIQQIDLMNNTVVIQTKEKEAQTEKVTQTKKAHTQDLKQEENKSQPVEEKTKGKSFVLPYNIVLLCDGANHEGASLVKSAVDKQISGLKSFAYQSFKYQPPKYNCAVRLRFKPIDQVQGGKYTRYADIPQRPNHNIKPFQEMGWDKQTIPPQFVLDDNWYKSSYDNFKPRMFVGAQIPEEMYIIKDEEQRRETIIKWAKNIVAYKYGISPDDLEFDPTGEDEQHKINATTFTSHMEYVIEPIVEIDDNYIVNMGASAIRPFYQAGLSANMALNEAIAVASCIENKRKNTFNRFETFIDRFNDDVAGMEKLLKEYGSIFPPLTSLYKSTLPLHSTKDVVTPPVEKNISRSETKPKDQDTGMEVSGEVSKKDFT